MHHSSPLITLAATVFWSSPVSGGRSKASPPPPPPPPSPLSGLPGLDASSLLVAVLVLSLVAVLTAAMHATPEVKHTWPTSVGIFHACPGGRRANASLWQRYSGGLAATIFTVTYIAVPLLLVIIPILLFTYPTWWLTWALAGPFVLSAITRPIPSRSFLMAWPFCHMGKYFNFTEIREQSDEEVQALVQSRSVIFSIQPHGVFSFGGACAGVEWANRWWHPRQIPTSAASSVIRTPLVKHVVGLFGVIDASNSSLSRWLGKGKSVVLYIGGIAELFLVSQTTEKLFARKRKGFIKLALRTGSEVVPVYFMGNTTVLSVLKGSLLRRLARATGITLTWFWGWGGTLVPRPNKMLGILGRPIGMPSTPIDQPTQEQIDAYHDKYLAEVQRLFESYKHLNPDYEHKKLEFE